MLNANQVPGSLSLNELAQQVVRVTEISAKIAADVGGALDSLLALEALLVRNPIAAWAGGKGMGGRIDFAYDAKGKAFSMTTAVSPGNREAFQEMVREVVDWRLAEYRSPVPPRVTVTRGIGDVEGGMLFRLHHVHQVRVCKRMDRGSGGKTVYSVNFVKGPLRGPSGSG
jgi:hypothetical protein